MEEGLTMSCPLYRQDIGESPRLRLWPEVQNLRRAAGHDRPKNPYTHPPATLSNPEMADQLKVADE